MKLLIVSLLMHKGSLYMNLETLKKVAPEQLQQQPVTAVLLALGSNYQAEKHLARVRENLTALGEIKLSTAFQNLDFTATLEHPKPDYTNQCVYLSLTTPIILQQLQQTFKGFESDCDRQRLAELQMAIKKVTMDIDILLIKLSNNKNSLSNKYISEWIVMADRYPFKAHEKAGIEELIERSGTNC